MIWQSSVPLSAFFEITDGPRACGRERSTTKPRAITHLWQQFSPATQDPGGSQDLNEPSIAAKHTYEPLEKNKAFIEKSSNKAGLVIFETLASPTLFVEPATTFAEGKELLR